MKDRPPSLTYSLRDSGDAFELLDSDGVVIAWALDRLWALEILLALELAQLRKREAANEKSK